MIITTLESKDLKHGTLSLINVYAKINSNECKPIKWILLKRRILIFNSINELIYIQDNFCVTYLMK